MHGYRARALFAGATATRDFCLVLQYDCLGTPPKWLRFSFGVIKATPKKAAPQNSFPHLSFWTLSFQMIMVHLLKITLRADPLPPPPQIGGLEPERWFAVLGLASPFGCKELKSALGLPWKVIRTSKLSHIFVQPVLGGEGGKNCLLSLSPYCSRLGNRQKRFSWTAKTLCSLIRVTCTTVAGGFIKSPVCC